MFIHESLHEKLKGKSFMNPLSTVTKRLRDESEQDVINSQDIHKDKKRRLNYNGTSVETCYIVLQLIVDLKLIEKTALNVLKNVSKKFLISTGSFPCKFDNDQIVNYKLLPSLKKVCQMNLPLDILDYAWGMRVTNIRLYYNIGDNRFKREVDLIKTLWKMNCLPNIHTLTIEIANAVYVDREENVQYPRVAELFFVFEKVIFSHCGNYPLTKMCHKLATDLFLPSLPRVKSGILSVHGGNSPWLMNDQDLRECKASYGKRSADFVTLCERNNLSVGFDLEGTLGSPWADDTLI